MKRRRACADDSGAALVEFAILAPLLLLLVVGTIEFGWLFAQNLDVRHGAREGVRLATVNFPEGSDPSPITRTQANTSSLLAETCSRMNIVSGVAVTFSSLGGVGDPIVVTASAPAQTLSGLFDWLIPDSLTLDSTVVLHAEQEATWADTDTVAYPNGQPCP